MTDFDWVGVVLAGGASSRMGRDKALIVVGGETLVERSTRVLGEAGSSRVLVVGGDRDAFAAGGVSQAAICPVELLPDAHPGEGPLGGIVTAIDSLPHPIALVVLACDLPFVSPDQVRVLLVAAAETAAVDVVLPVVEGRRQYLHSLWMPSSHAAARQSFAEGARAVRQPLSQGLRTLEVNPSAADPYRDVDTPSQLNEAQGVGSPSADRPEENNR